jgi:hypothetical protein
MTYLRLDVGHLAGRHLVFVQRDLGQLEVTQEAKLAGKQEQERLSSPTGTRGTTDTVDVFARVIRRVVLDDPVHGRDVETTGGNVRAQQNAVIRVDELEKGGGTLLLLLTTLCWRYRTSRRRISKKKKKRKKEKKIRNKFQSRFL